MDLEPQDPTEVIWPDPAEDDELPDDYVPAYRRKGSVLLGNDPISSLPTINRRMPQLRPRNAKRNPLLDELAERNRNKPNRPSGHSLIRGI